MSEKRFGKQILLHSLETRVGFFTLREIVNSCLAKTVINQSLVYRRRDILFNCLKMSNQTSKQREM